MAMVAIVENDMVVLLTSFLWFVQNEAPSRLPHHKLDPNYFLSVISLPTRVVHPLQL